MPSILITDSLFLPVGGPDEQRLRAAGYDIDRLDVPRADEATLAERIAGKSGYLLGGAEEVTEAVIAAADRLEAIAFTGSGYAEFIPAWESATARGIAISAARGENADAVAEWSLVSGLALVRRIPELTAPDGPRSAVTHEFGALTWGVVGYGAIGRRLAQKAGALGLRVVTPAATDDPGVSTVDLPELLATSDVVSVHVSKRRGDGVLDARAVARLRTGAVLVNAAFEGAVDDLALSERLRAGEIRAAVDYPLVVEGLEPGRLLASNAQTAFDTAEANARVARRATSSLLNLLRTGDDADLVNPEHRNHR